MMEKLCGHDQVEDQLDMPPGFRFHPTDEELITNYLLNKVADDQFFAKAIGEVDMNKTEPWDLPGLAKLGGKEWYFFCVRDKKYPTGLRTNRATTAGYWKATGKDKEIYRGRSLIGMKKTLVFYMGRAPKGDKTNWVIHEYRLDGRSSHSKSSKNEWVICRVFHKSLGGKKLHISELMTDSGGVDNPLPPLMTAYDSKIIDPNTTTPGSIRVPCFSNSAEIQTNQKDMISYLLNNPVFSESNYNMLLGLQSDPDMHQFHSVSPLRARDEAILIGTTGSQDTGVSTKKNSEASLNLEKGIMQKTEGQEAPSTSGGPFDLDCIWNY
ncbi:hypothetical protein R6Q59_034192 [Mikania micrantha]